MNEAGDSENKFEFTDHKNHNQYLLCKICTNLMIKPIRLHRCGHTLCNKCVQPTQLKQCPVCLQKIHQKQPDILATRLIGQLQVKCKNNGCPWKGTYQNYLNNHKQKCKLKDGGIEAWLEGIENMIKQKGVLPTLEENSSLEIGKLEKLGDKNEVTKQIEKLHEQRNHLQEVKQGLKNQCRLQKQLHIENAHDFNKQFKI